MKNMKEVLGKKINDEIAGCAILISILITVTTVIGIYTFVKNQQDVTTASFGVEGEEKLEGSIENLTPVEEMNNNIEKLQELNENEIEEAKQDDKKTQTTTTTAKYYIKVNYKAQVVTIYTKDEDGKYTKPVKAMVCSTGTYTPTSGVYKVPYKYRWLRMVGGVYAQYCTQIVGNILFHSVPYLERGNHASLEYWEYDKLGTKASLGCIRLTCQDAKWIYDNCKIGTQVEFYSSSNPGPLGKPSARKISSAPSSVRGWDPTDPASGNPWKEYLEEQEKKESNDKDKDTNTKDDTNTDTNTSTNTDTNINTDTKPTQKPSEPSTNTDKNDEEAGEQGSETVNGAVGNESIHQQEEEDENGMSNDFV